MNEEDEVKDETKNEAASEWLEPSPVGDEFMNHARAMEPASRVPTYKAFAIAPGFNVGMLRKMAEAYKPKRIVVIDHGEPGFEVRRLGANDDVSLFYATLNPQQFERLAKQETQGEEEQISSLRRIIAEYLQMEEVSLVKYDAHGPKLQKLNCVGHSYLHRRTAGIAAFRKDAEGSTAAIKKALLQLESEGLLRKLTEEQANELFGITATVYQINKNSLSNT